MIAGWKQRRVEKRDVQFAADLYNEAVRLMQQGRMEDAERALRKSAQLRAERLGADAAETLESRVSLARVLQHLNRQDDARLELGDVVERAGGVYGDGHRVTATARILLGTLLIAGGNPLDAKEHAQAVLATRQSSDRLRLQAWDVKVRALTALGRHREAADEAASLRLASAAVYGDNHVLTLKVGSDRVQNLVFLGEFDQAERECRAIISARGEQGLLWLAVNNALVLALIGLGRFDEAETTARAALLQQRRVTQPSGDMRLALSLGLARSLTARGRDDEALQVTLDAKADILRTPGGRVSLPAALGVATARALLGLRRFDDAETEVRRAITVSESSLSPTHHGTLEATTLLGTVLAAQGRRAEAKRQLDICVTAWNEYFGPTHPRAAAAAAELAALD